jgi:hypothetical protein
VQQAAELIEAGTASGGMIPKSGPDSGRWRAPGWSASLTAGSRTLYLNEINKAEGGTTITRD